jgi:hypothetical protein
MVKDCKQAKNEIGCAWMGRELVLQQVTNVVGEKCKRKN